jgi:hypothetical protein
MYHLNLLNRFETRNVVIDLNNNNINKIDLVIQEAMNFEILLLRNKLQNSSALIEDYKRRIDLLSSRK